MATPLYKLAKELGVENKILMAILQERGMPIKRAIDALSQPQHDAILERFPAARPAAAAKPAAPAPAVTAKPASPAPAPATKPAAPAPVAPPATKAAAPSAPARPAATAATPPAAAGAPLKPVAPTPTAPASAGAPPKPAGAAPAASPSAGTPAKPAVATTAPVATAPKTPPPAPVPAAGPAAAPKTGAPPANGAVKAPVVAPPPAPVAPVPAAPAPAAPPQAPAFRTPPPPPARPRYRYRGPVSIGDLAKAFNVRASDIIKSLLAEKQMVTLNQRVGLEVVRHIGEKFEFEVDDTLAGSAAGSGTKTDEGAADLNRKPRAPVVTIMGHVDHGKTSLLDAIRETDVAAGEAGGITQHLSAFRVTLSKGGSVVFLDTPGHEAFTSLRARGAKVTDVVVLVVAADDGVMPQTLEAAAHAKAAGVPIVVAINKMDKPGANPQRVMQQLAEHELVPEEWGGKTIMVPVSALKKTGLDKLLELLLLEAELLELTASPEGPGEGTVLEARMHKTRGPVATVLVDRGTLRVGDVVQAGSAYGRVRMLLDDRGAQLREAGPSTPVELLGLSSVPEAGSRLRAVEDERTARLVAEETASRRKDERLQRRHITLQDISTGVAAGERKELRLVVKADVQGSLEALHTSVLRLANDQVKLAVLHEGVGPVNQSDVALAAASDAVIVGFHVGIEPGAEPLIRQEGVEVRRYSIIYEAIEELKKAMEGLLAPKVQEVALGRAEVRATFRTPRGVIAGCFITTGKAVRNERLRVVRNGDILHEGSVSSLRRFKEDVREVAQGYECGISTEGFNDFVAGDLIEMYTRTLVQEKLKI